MKVRHVLIAAFYALLMAGGALGQSFTIGRNWDAFGGGFFPPDTMGAVGPNHVGVMINGHWMPFDKNGNPQGYSSLNSFWTNAGAAWQGSYTFDPRILYDPFSERWFATAVDNASNANNLLVAVSSSSDPTQAWTGWAIDADSNDTHWADFPMLGMNADMVVVQANMFPISSGSTDRTTLVLPKSDLLALTPTVANATLFQETLFTNNPGFSAQPTVDLDNGNLPLIMLSAYSKPSGLLKTSSIGGTAATPTLNTSGGWISVTARSSPPDIDQPGPKQDIDAGDGRFSGNVIIQQHEWRTNPSLWAVHGVEISGKAAIEWYEIDSLTNAVLQNGTITDSELAFNYPSIAVNDDGDVVIGFSGADDTSTFMSTFVVAGSTTGGLTTLSPVTMTRSGVTDYEKLDTIDRNRWGDYSSTVIDPTNDKHFWTFQEYCRGADLWDIQVTEIIIPEPATLGLLLVGGLAVLLRTRS